MLYVADRENGRIQCFDTDGKFHKQISSKKFGGLVFAIDFNNQGMLLFRFSVQVKKLFLLLWTLSKFILKAQKLLFFNSFHTPLRF